MANEVKFRPATMAEVEGRDVDLYMNGERVYVMMIMRSETIGEDSEPKLDYIWLTNMKKVQLEDLQVIDDDGETKDNNNINNQNNSEDEVMTNETMKVADLIGKSISNGGNAKYTINAIEGDKVKVTFQMGDSEGKPMTMGVAQVEKLLQGGWKVSDGEKKADGGSQKAEEPKAEKKADGRSQKAEEPKAKTVKMEKPKQEKSKAEQPETCNVKPETKTGKLVYSAYTNAKGKACAKISGFAETDAAYQQAVSLHGSATYENTKQGRVNYLIFGPRYAEVAKTICQMLNEGRTVADCQAVVDRATEERAQKREERKQKRAAYRQEHEGKSHQPSSGKVYTEAEVADLMRRVIEGDEEAIAIVNAMAA